MASSPYIKNIAFDLDGVIRNLYKPLEKIYGFKIEGYNFTHKGMDFWDMIKENSEVWTHAPVTKYYKIIKQYVPKIEIWTFQKNYSRVDTEHWIAKHFDNYDVKYFSSGSDKYKYLREQHDYMLVEDTSSFADYTRVILIDQPWNNILQTHIEYQLLHNLKKY